MGPWAAWADKARLGLLAQLDEFDRGEEREREGLGVLRPRKSCLQQTWQVWLQTSAPSCTARKAFAAE